MVVIDEKTKTAVTGMAWTTALGTDLNAVWTSLLEGKSGLKHLDSRYNLRNELAGAIENNDLNSSPGEHLYTITKNTIQRALNDAGIKNDGNKILLILGTSFGARLDDDIISKQLLHDWIDVIADELGLSLISLSTACSSASDAILTASALIRSGYADICICGGSDILGASKLLAHSALGTMSPTTLKSFDQNRDGTILGEGSGFIVLEKYTDKLNKKVYAFLRGCGSANDASGLTSPDLNYNGIRLAVNKSLRDANLQQDQIDIINAHASGTLTNDIIEMNAYKSIFSHQHTLIFATKGAFGHSLGATGVLEAIALIMALSEQNAPPITNLSNPLESDFFILPQSRINGHDALYGLSLTIGFGGFNTSLIFERYSRE